MFELKINEEELKIEVFKNSQYFFSASFNDASDFQEAVQVLNEYKGTEQYQQVVSEMVSLMTMQYNPLFKNFLEDRQVS